MKAATERRPRGRDARLLVVDESGLISSRTHRELPPLLPAGSLLIANDAATLPASLAGVFVPTGEPIEVRLAAWSEARSRFVAIVFGNGDYRTQTEDRPLPPALHAGDELRIASLRARVVGTQGHPRLIELEFEDPPAVMWDALARNGRPVQYAHVQRPLALWDTWTSIAASPVAFEPPSAGFILDWSMLTALRRRGVRFATLTHAAGISSTGDPALDGHLPLDEPYWIPSSTAALIQRTRAEGGRIIALGTTVVRALEHAARATGHVVAGKGLATGRIGAESLLRVADAVVSGVHEPGTSHYDLLRAFHPDAVLVRMWQEAEMHDYATHEFGDSVLIVRPNAAKACCAA